MSIPDIHKFQSIGQYQKSLPYFFDILDADSEKHTYQSMRKWGWFSLLYPSMERAIWLYGRGLAEARSTQIAIMIERYRRANGKLPEALADLIPVYAESLPLDPFTGKDLIYKQEDTGYVVYSVGEDLEDQGGKLEYGEGEKKHHRDWGIRVRRPAK